MTQTEMTFTPVARNSDPETSHAAAKSVRSGTQQECWEFIVQMLSFRPLHDEAIVSDLFSESGLRTRRNELVKMGYVEYSGMKTTTAAGRPTRIWQLTEKGKRMARHISSGITAVFRSEP